MTYQPPVRDHAFILADILNIDQYGDLPGFAQAPMDVVSQIMEESGRFTAEVLAPLNAVGDKEGCHWLPDHTVTTPKGFKAAYAQMVAGGWPALGAAPAYGGQGLPHVINLSFTEMTSSANMAFGMYPGLTHGAYSAILAGGSQDQKDLYLPKLASGQWGGTMNLTEPHCGTDLGLLRTKAVPQADGSYKISGTKIWISGGEHDLAETSFTWSWPGSRGHRRGFAEFPSSSCLNSCRTPTAIRGNETASIATVSKRRWAFTAMPPASCATRKPGAGW